MPRPVVGWEETHPVPDHQFNDYLSVRSGRLFMDGLDLTQLFLGDSEEQGLGRTLPSPLEIVYLPIVGKRIDAMRNSSMPMPPRPMQPKR